MITEHNISPNEIEDAIDELSMLLRSSTFSTTTPASLQNANFRVLIDPRRDWETGTYCVLITCSATRNPWLSWDKRPLVVTPIGDSSGPVSMVRLNGRGQALVRNLPRGDYRITMPLRYYCLGNPAKPKLPVLNSCEPQQQSGDPPITVQAERHPDGTLSIDFNSYDSDLANATVRFALVKHNDETVYCGEARLVQKQAHGSWKAHWSGLMPMKDGEQHGLSLFALLDQSEPKVDVHRLPIPAVALVGRKDELKQLDACLDASDVPIVTVRAAGGIGKSALIDEWLHRQALYNYGDARLVFGYSFYSQSTHTTYTSSSDFFDVALPFFGYEGELPTEDVDKALALSKLLATQQSILVLDGVEPLQHRPTEQQGWFADAAMRALLRELVRSGLPAGGLIVVSSRQPIAELEAHRNKQYREIELGHLSEAEGADLLASFGVRGRESQLRQASTEWGGHALALVLLGGLLVEAYHGEVARRDIIPSLIATPEDAGDHARRVMRYYDETHWAPEAPERRLLYLLGLFDRPLSLEERNVLLAAPEVATDLPRPWDPAWTRMETRLENAGLLMISRKGSERQTWDTHPLIREYFGSRLRQQKPDIWRQAHRVLVDHFQNRASPDTSVWGQLERLYRAVHHACQAGDYQRAMEIRSKSILRGNKFFGLSQLGSFGLDLAALAGFFENSWSTPIAAGNETGLTDFDRMALLGSAAYDLASLGRLSEAIDARQAQRELAIQLEDWRQAVDASENLVELKLLKGQLNSARQIAAEGLRQARLSGEDFRRMIMQAQYGALLYRLGDLGGSLAAFKEAERLQARFQPERPRLYALHGMRYCALLLELECDPKDLWEIHARAEEGYKIAQTDDKVLEMSLYRMMQGLCRVALGSAVQSRDALDEAVTRMRTAQKMDFMPRVLLARARLLGSTGDRDAAQDDLNGALDIAEWCSMDLYRVEGTLLLANLKLDEWNLHRRRSYGGRTVDDREEDADNPLICAQRLCQDAQDLIDETDCGLRRQELSLLQARISIYRGDLQQAQTKLEAVKEYMHSIGRYGLRSFVEGVDKELASILGGSFIEEGGEK